ncbi:MULTISPECIES: hypothetical protein [Streptacidiphilus]|uniref:Uncharacterized protein n=1 Tax=Streptacidiphilus cavernicola TaxID=3342716 RepID=A0ABV6UTR2_9ACTN|nr:hypothetical protein [Streptacidiphilus jeojiense]
MAEIAALAVPQPEVRLLPVDDNTLTRLHALACFFCGTTTGPLVPAGHVYTGDGDGARYGWPVVACPEHVADQPPQADRP